MVNTSIQRLWMVGGIVIDLRTIRRLSCRRLFIGIARRCHQLCQGSRSARVPRRCSCDRVVATKRAQFAFSRINEFYKKGCQEKTPASAGVEVLFLDTQPRFYPLPKWKRHS